MEEYQALFDKSFQLLTSNETTRKAFFIRFYKNFIMASSEVEEKFSQTDMSKQNSMLYFSFMNMLEYSITRQETPRLVEIANIHSKKHHNIPPHLYEHWLNALILTVNETFPDTTKSTIDAWIKTFQPGIEYMKAHH